MIKLEQLFQSPFREKHFAIGFRTLSPTVIEFFLCKRRSALASQRVIQHLPPAVIGVDKHSIQIKENCFYVREVEGLQSDYCLYFVCVLRLR